MTENIDWEFFFEWAKTYRREVQQGRSDYQFLDTDTVTTRLAEDQDSFEPDPDVNASGGRRSIGRRFLCPPKLVKRKISLFKHYYQALSLDAVDMLPSMKQLLKYQSTELCKLGYGFWLGRETHGHLRFIDRVFVPETAMANDIPDCGISLFAGNYKDIDFASLFTAYPFNLLHVRNAAGRQWNELEISAFRDYLQWDLRFDGLLIELSERWTWGFSTGCMLSLALESEDWVPEVPARG